MKLVPKKEFTNPWAVACGKGPRRSAWEIKILGSGTGFWGIDWCDCECINSRNYLHACMHVRMYTWVYMYWSDSFNKTNKRTQHTIIFSLPLLVQSLHIHAQKKLPKKKLPIFFTFSLFDCNFFFFLII